jgi:hypothetical protein
MLVAPPKPSELYQGTVTMVAMITQPGGLTGGPTSDPNSHGGIGNTEPNMIKLTSFQFYDVGAQGCHSYTLTLYSVNHRP